MKTNMHIHVRTYLARFFLKREMFRTKDVEKFKIYIIALRNLFFGNNVVYEITWENMVEPNRPQIKS